MSQETQCRRRWLLPKMAKFGFCQLLLCNIYRLDLVGFKVLA